MDEKSEYIIQEGSKLFKRYSIRSVSMDDIARELGMSKKTIYQHFNNKAQLIESILEHELMSVEILTKQTMEKKLNAIDILLEITRELSLYYKDTDPSSEYDLIKYYPEVYQAHKGKRDRLIKHYLIENLRQGKKEGYFRTELEEDIIANIYLKAITEFLSPDFIEKQKFSFTKLFKILFENHIRAIANSKGISYFEQQQNSKKFNI